ncbi:MAG: hypothetical protein Q9166_006292 [cf. Caloplaca sp. 2 TL-2023]
MTSSNTQNQPIISPKPRTDIITHSSRPAPTRSRTVVLGLKSNTKANDSSLKYTLPSTSRPKTAPRDQRTQLSSSQAPSGDMGMVRSDRVLDSAPKAPGKRRRRVTQTNVIDHGHSQPPISRKSNESISSSSTRPRSDSNPHSSARKSVFKKNNEDRESDRAHANTRLSILESGERKYVRPGQGVASTSSPNGISESESSQPSSSNSTMKHGSPSMGKTSDPSPSILFRQSDRISPTGLTPTPCNRQRALSIRPQNIIVSSTDSETHPEFRAAQIASPTSGDLTTTQLRKPDDSSESRSQRSQPIREVKVLASIEHDVDFDDPDDLLSDDSSPQNTETSFVLSLSPSASLTDAELSLNEQLSEARRQKGKVGGNGSAVAQARDGCLGTAASDDQSASVARMKRELTAALEIAEYRAVSQQVSKQDGDVLVGNRSEFRTARDMTSLKRQVALSQSQVAQALVQVAELASLLQELMKLQLDQQRNPAHVAQVNSAAWLGRANVAVDNFRATIALNTHETSTRAANSLRDQLDATTHVAEPMEGNYEDSGRRRQSRSATISNRAKHDSGASVDVANSQPTGTSCVLGSQPDGGKSRSKPSKRRKRDGGQSFDQAELEKHSALRDGALSHQRDEGFSVSESSSPVRRPRARTALSNADMPIMSPSSLGLRKTPHGHDRAHSLRHVSPSHAPVGASTRAHSWSYDAVALGPINHEQSGQLWRKKRRRSSTVSPCHRTQKEHGHSQSKGLQTKQYIRPTSRPQGLQTATPSQISSVPGATRGQTTVDVPGPHRDVLNLSATGQEVVGSKIDTVGLLGDRACSRAKKPTIVNNLGVSQAAQPERSKQGKPLEDCLVSAAPGTAAAGKPSDKDERRTLVGKGRKRGISKQQREKTWGKQKNVSETGMSGQSPGSTSSQSVVEAKAYQQQMQRTNARSQDFEGEPGAADSEEPISNVEDGCFGSAGNKHSQRRELSRDVSEFPDLDTVLKQMRISRNLGDVRSESTRVQAQAQGNGDAGMAPQPDTTIKNLFTGKQTTPRNKKRSHDVATMELPVAPKSANIRGPTIKRPRHSPIHDIELSKSLSSPQTAPQGPAAHQPSRLASSIPHRSQSAPQGIQNNKVSTTKNNAHVSNTTHSQQRKGRPNFIPGMMSISQKLHQNKRVPQTRQWNTQQKYPEVRIPQSNMAQAKAGQSETKSSHRDCRCSGLPQYFYEDAHTIPSLATWHGCKEEFIVHCQQIVECPGHLSPIRQACRSIIDAERGNIQADRPKAEQLFREVDMSNIHLVTSHTPQIGNEEGLAFATDFLTSGHDMDEDPFISHTDRPNCRDHSTIPSKIWYGKYPPFRVPPGLSRLGTPVQVPELDDVCAAAITDKQARDKPLSNQGPSGLPTPVNSSSPVRNEDHQFSSSTQQNGFQASPPPQSTSSGVRRPSIAGGVTAESPATPAASSPLSRTIRKTKKTKKSKKSEPFDTIRSPELAPRKSKTHDTRPRTSGATLFRQNLGLGHDQETQLLVDDDTPLVLSMSTASQETPTQRAKIIRRRHDTEPPHFSQPMSPTAVVKRGIMNVARPPLASLSKSILNRQLKLPAHTIKDERPLYRRTPPPSPPRKKRRLLAEERKERRPELSREVPMDQRKSDRQLIEIGFKENSYNRHRAAPYAFGYRGYLYADYRYLARMTDSSGELLWDAALQHKLIKW